ncbi:secondary thiamine-phosphate synthase enzyme [Halarchaeum solikamskense]|uniref:secondary thiamine-phosphate synthase enzyme YjbQ n=1 Tax=Halarchaeum nitratireducens TaxID=489913 RepID=UPI001B3ABB49|nr:secondary thiamine-phosphate synthase enzyme [Halarchaeum solikamskense]
MRLSIDTTDRLAVTDVTARVADAVPSDVERGVCTVFVPHTTAGVVVNEAESGLLDDVEAVLARLVPDDDYAHDAIDDNADAHLRALLLGSSVSVPVADGSLDLGTWQSVLFVECDGPRTRSIDVRVAPTTE